MKMLNRIKDFALSQPESVAFCSPTKEITYRELWAQSEQVANYLLKQNLTSDSPILVYGHMEPEMIVTFLGSVKSGRAYIPVDTSIPVERIKRILDSSKAELVINVSSKPILLEGTSSRVINFSELETISNEEVDPSNWVNGDENFYIIYTSGSTGNPKGVQITANNLTSFVDWMVEDFPITGQLQFLNQAPFSFDLSVMDLYPALSSGGNIYAITKELIERPKDLFIALKKSNLQVWTSTPSFAQMCLMDPSFNQELLPDLTVFMFCGEVLPGQIARQLKERFPNAKIFNTYGPTEATVAVTYVEITDQLINDFSSLPIGVSKKDTKVLVLNEDGEEVGEGEKGEITIIGPSVSKGYLHEPEKTEKSFFSINGVGAYKTGDAGYIENGLLFYKGRLDFQIKLHGYRLELEEIEYHIASSQFVREVLVIPETKNDKVEYLTAAVIPVEHGFEKEYQLTSAIKKELSEILPAYMIPRKFVYSTDFPMTPNGKKRPPAN